MQHDHVRRKTGRRGRKRRGRQLEHEHPHDDDDTARIHEEKELTNKDMDNMAGQSGSVERASETIQYITSILLRTRHWVAPGLGLITGE